LPISLIASAFLALRLRLSDAVPSTFLGKPPPFLDAHFLPEGSPILSFIPKISFSVVPSLAVSLLLFKE